jgi:hypothetical protein
MNELITYGERDMKKTVKVTREYDQFKFLQGNRPINQSHVLNLRKSIMDNYVPTPIIVNEEKQIIDGQHRYIVLKELNLPMFYVTTSGKISLDDIRQINKNAKNWDFADYLHSHMEIEKAKNPKDYHIKPYHIFDWFKRSYQLPNYVVLEIIYGTYSMTGTQAFKDGRLEIIDLAYSKNIASYLRSMKPYYDGWNRRSFLFAMLRIMFQKQFNKAKWLRKIKLNSRKLVHCTCVADYIEVIEHIYNWGEPNKVMFVKEKTHKS